MMKKQRILILGAGISGLTTAWHLSQTGLPLDIEILEKSSRIGGWLHTDHTTGYHFEKGPRTFKVDKCPGMVQLVAELGLGEEVVWSEAKPHHRYLWLEGELHRFPTHPLHFLLSPITKGFIPALLKEWRQPVKAGDETVWEFVLRRYNYDVARLFFDPLVIGIFGGDIRKISVRACFPKLKMWEEKYGSITRGFWEQWKAKRGQSPFSKALPQLPLSAIFSFRRGIEQLPQALAARTPASIHVNQEVKEIAFEGSEIRVETADDTWVVDYLFCALPAKETAQLFKPHASAFCKELAGIPSAGIAVVNFAYDSDVLPVQGFGYLTPTYAHEEILGVIFDSSIFHQHNRRENETRLTIKLEESDRSEEYYIEAALKGIRRHLGISQTPKAMTVKKAIRAIPQYGVGHLEKMADLKALFQKRLKRCFLVGNYLSGVSVEQCIARAKEAVLEWQGAI